MTPLTLDASDYTPSNPYQYLEVDAFLRDFAASQALAAAVKLGLIEELRSRGPLPTDDLSEFLGQNSDPLLLIRILETNEVVHEESDGWQLTPAFKCIAPFSDYLLSKIEFSNLISSDLQEHFDLFVTDMSQFMRSAEVFELFGYHRCFDVTEENLTTTHRWMRFTTALTRHEARVVAAETDFSSVNSVLDIGGNSGEFVLQLCKSNPHLAATVVDLPVVCAIGEKHLAMETERERISFHVADAIREPLPSGFDMVTFKSLLHDWPIQGVDLFLEKGVASLATGGRLLIFERGPLNLGTDVVDYSMIPMLLFNRSFRPPDHYINTLARLGLQDISIREIQLDTPFYLIEAVKAS